MLKLFFFLSFSFLFSQENDTLFILTNQFERDSIIKLSAENIRINKFIINEQIQYINKCMKFENPGCNRSKTISISLDSINTIYETLQEENSFDKPLGIQSRYYLMNLTYLKYENPIKVNEIESGISFKHCDIDYKYFKAFYLNSIIQKHLMELIYDQDYAEKTQLNMNIFGAYTGQIEYIVKNYESIKLADYLIFDGNYIFLNELAMANRLSDFKVIYLLTELDNRKKAVFKEVEFIYEPGDVGKSY